MKIVRILIIDDNPTVLELARAAIKLCIYGGFSRNEYRYEIIFAYNGIQGWEQACDLQPDVIVSDVKMPGMNGLEFTRRLRSDPRTVQIPLILLSALTSEEDQIRGLLSGCDGYVTKPFKPLSLFLLVEASLRRKEREQQSFILSLADVQMDIQSHTVVRGEREIQLTPIEYQMLECFLRHPGQTLKRSFLRNQIWGIESDIESNIVDVYVGYLRKKLETGGAPRLIHTKRGIGYMLEKQ